MDPSQYIVASNNIFSQQRMSTNMNTMIHRYGSKYLRSLPFKIGTTSASKMGDTDPILFIDSVAAGTRTCWFSISISGFNFGCGSRCGWKLR